MNEPLQLPSGARCAAHPEALAVATCMRCGDFACATCASSGAPGLCVKCAPRAGHALYHPVSVAKLVIMSLATFGLYEVYFGYRCWQFVRNRDRSAIWPFARAFFFGITYFELVKDIASTSLMATDPAATPPTFLSKLSSGARALVPVGFLLTTAAWRLPDPFWWISFSSVIFLIPAAVSIQQLNAARGVPAASLGMGWKHWLIAVVGGLLLTLAIIGSMLPD